MAASKMMYYDLTIPSPVIRGITDEYEPALVRERFEKLAIGQYFEVESKKFEGPIFVKVSDRTALSLRDCKVVRFKSTKKVTPRHVLIQVSKMPLSVLGEKENLILIEKRAKKLEAKDSKFILPDVTSGTVSGHVSSISPTETNKFVKHEKPKKHKVKPKLKAGEAVKADSNGLVTPYVAAAEVKKINLKKMSGSSSKNKRK